MEKQLLVEPDNAKVFDGIIGDEVWKRITDFVADAYEIVSEEINNWENGVRMYDDCYNTDEDNVKRYNPDMLKNITDRVIEGLGMSDFILRIPKAKEYEKQIVRDYITQVMQQSGLTSELRDDDKGVLSWALLGSLILNWGKADDDEIEEGIPIKFQSWRLSKCFISSSSVKIRDYNGKRDANELFLIEEVPYEQALEEYENKKVEKKSPYTGKIFGKGKLPVTISDDRIQRETEEVQDEQNNITEIGHYFNLYHGIYQVRIGEKATPVELYDDNDPRLPNFPFKYNNKNYLPIELLKLFTTIGKLYGKGTFHRYGKIARNDASLRNMAHQFADDNVNADRFLKMDITNLETFQTQLDLHRQLKAEGERTYIPIGLQEEVVAGDLRSQPLTNEFERLRNDIVQIVTEGGVAIKDVDRPASESATATLSEEKAKTRLTDSVVEKNAGATTFLVKIVIDFIRKYIKKDNKTSVATNVKMPLTDSLPAGIMQESMNALRQAGANEDEIQKFKNDIEKEEISIENITAGEVAEFMRNREIYIQEDYSQWNKLSYKLRLLDTALAAAAGTPAQIKIQQQKLAALGIEVTAQELSPDQTNINQANAQANVTQTAKLGQDMGLSRQPTPVQV